MAWLKTMSDRGDVDYTTIQEVFKQTHDVSRNLGVVSQIIVAIAVTVATGGSGAAALTAIGTTATATTAAMATAAIASASTMVATASINSGLNGEGLAGVYDRLNNDGTWKNLATSVITAGVTSGISSQLSATTINPVTGLPVASNGLNTLAGAKNLLVLNLANAGASAGINTAINGGSFGDNLRTSLTAAVANTVGAIGFNASADSFTLGWERGVGHALVGATTGYVVGGDSESALAGAAGAITSYGISHGLGNAGLSNDQLSGLAQVGGVLTSTLVTGDGDYAATGQNAANLEFQYNYLNHKDIDELNKKIKQCDGNHPCERDARNWAKDRHFENEDKLKACGDDQTCLLGHAALIQAGTRELSEIGGDNVYLSQVNGLAAQIDVWNTHDFKLIPQNLQTPAMMGGFAISHCGGQWSPACAGAFKDEVARQQGNAKLLVGAVAVSGTVGVAPSAMAACAINAVCRSAASALGLILDMDAMANFDPTFAFGLAGKLGTAAKSQDIKDIATQTEKANVRLAKDSELVGDQPYIAPKHTVDAPLQTHGISIEQVPEPLQIHMMRELEAGGFSNPRKTLDSIIESGKTIPFPMQATADARLYKLVDPNGRYTTPNKTTVYWIDDAQLNLIRAHPDRTNDILGLPASSQAASYNVFEIQPKPSTKPTVYKSQIATTTNKNGPTNVGGGVQTIVPNRSLWTDPKSTGITIKVK